MNSDSEKIMYEEVSFDDTEDPYLLKIHPEVMKVENFIDNYDRYDVRDSIMQCGDCSKIVDKFMYEITSNDHLNTVLSPVFNKMRVQLIRIKEKCEKELSLKLTSSFKINTSQLNKSQKRSITIQANDTKMTSLPHKIKKLSGTFEQNDFQTEFDDYEISDGMTARNDPNMSNGAKKPHSSTQIHEMNYDDNGIHVVASEPTITLLQQPPLNVLPLNTTPMITLLQPSLNNPVLLSTTPVITLPRPALNFPVTINQSSNVPMNVLQSFDTADVSRKKIIVKSLFSVPFSLTLNEILYVLSKCKEKQKNVAVKLPLTFPSESILFNDESSIKQLNGKSKEQFLKFSERYEKKESRGNDNLCLDKLLIKTEEIRSELLENLALENGIKRETKFMTDLLSDRRIVPDDSSTLPFPFHLRDEICASAKFIHTDIDIPDEKTMQDTLVQCALVNYSTLNKVGISIANVHMKPDGTKYMTCDRFRGSSEYKKMTSLNVIYAGKHECLVKMERSLIMLGRIAGIVSNRHGDTPKAVQEPALNNRRGYGVLYLAQFTDEKDELKKLERRNCPIAPADSASVILISELNKKNIFKTSICFICGIACDEETSAHGMKHSQLFFNFSCDFSRLGFLNYEDIMLNVLGAYKKKHKVESLIKHLENQDKIYKNYYVLSQSVNFFGCVFVEPDAALVHRKGYESSTMAILEDKIFKSTKLALSKTVLRQRFFERFFKSIEFETILMNIIAHNRCTDSAAS